jgi:hypothetical protein
VIIKVKENRKKISQAENINKVNRVLKSDGIEQDNVAVRRSKRLTETQIRDNEISELNKLHKDKKFTDDGEKFIVDNIYWDTRKKKILVDYHTIKGKEEFVSLWTEIKDSKFN